MPSKIISVGYEIPGHSDDFHDYDGDQSLLDGDVVVFQPKDFGDVSEKPQFGEDYSASLQTSTQHWKRELTTALESGKTVFLILRKYRVAVVYTGRNEIKGSRKVNYVEDYHNYNFLPAKLPSIISKGGSEVLFTGQAVFASFWKEFQDNLRFESYLDGQIETPVFTTKTGGKPLGGIVKVGNGSLVILPTIHYDDKEFIKVNKSTGAETWTPKALAFGNRLVTSLLQIDKQLKINAQKTPAPAWVQSPSYVSPVEVKILAEIEKIKTETDLLAQSMEQQKKGLEEEGRLKDLLFETGIPLENAVIIALKLLGYSAENYDDGTLELDQVIISPEGQRFIGECEGKDNSAINIDKLRQLEENIHTDFEREEIEERAYGILFGNGFRLTEPEKRSEQFTSKCLTSAKRGIILVRTSDLFAAAKYLKENTNLDYAAACRAAIIAGGGGIVSFPKSPVS